MKICRFNDDRIGIVLGDEVADVTSVIDSLPSVKYPFPRGDAFINALPSLLPRMREAAKNAPRLALAGVKLLSPVANPGKIVAAPVNYVDHLAEATSMPELHHGNQIHQIQKVGLFLKATSSLHGSSHGVYIEHADRRNDHEAELVAIIGKGGRNIRREDALGHVAAYCIGLDMTVRGPEERSMRKSIDSYSVAGPWMVTADEVPDPNALDFHLTVNGEDRQRANTRDLILDVAELIEFATSFYSLEPGDTIHVEFDSIGAMDVKVHAKRH